MPFTTLHPPRRSPGLLLLLAALSAACGTYAQTSGTGMGSGQGRGISSASPHDLPFQEQEDARNAQIEHSRAQAREVERQRRMVDDANRLVELATLYRAHMKEHGERTPEDTKLLLEMEKLARSVKDRMRGM